MKKIVFITALAVLVSGTAFAQEAQRVDTTETVEYSSDKFKVETNHFWDNWFITAGGGAQIYFGDHDRQISFGKRLSPVIDVTVGKWFSPEMGVRFGYNGITINGATRWGAAHSTGEQVEGWGEGLYYSSFNYFNLHVDAMLNLSNVLGGYKDRFYTIVPYVGVGLAHAYNDPKKTSISGDLGIYNAFRLCPAVDLVLDVRGTMVGDDFEAEMGGRSGEGLVSASIGLTYKFNERGWNRSKIITRTNLVYNEADIAAMREQIDRMTEENARLNEELAKAKDAASQSVVKQFASPNLVVFKINKSKLSNEARANLGLLAEAIKQGSPEVVYTITGYADAGTGNPQINEALSKARAEAVYDCLVNEFGVDAKQLEMDYKGGVENMFYDDPRVSRAVITRASSK